MLLRVILEMTVGEGKQIRYWWVSTGSKKRSWTLRGEADTRKGGWGECCLKKKKRSILRPIESRDWVGEAQD